MIHVYTLSDVVVDAVIGHCIASTQKKGLET